MLSLCYLHGSSDTSTPPDANEHITCAQKILKISCCLPLSDLHGDKEAERTPAPSFHRTYPSSCVGWLLVLIGGIMIGSSASALAIVLIVCRTIWYCKLVVVSGRSGERGGLCGPR